MYVIPYPPTINTYYRHFRGRTVLATKGREWQNAAYYDLLGGGAIVGLRGPVSVELDVYPPDNRVRDLDNIIKPVLDLLEIAGFIENDVQVARLVVTRRNVRPPGRVMIRISEWD